MTNAPTLKIHNQFLKKALSLLCLLSLFSCASLNLSESRYNLQGKILFTENGEKKDFRIKIIKENESLQVLFLDILGFSMGGIIGNYWISKLDGYKRTIRFISVGSPHNGTLTAQLVPGFLFKGISEMKLNSFLLRELSKDSLFLKDIQCISLFTIWDLMVLPGWKAHLPKGMKISLNVMKHRNLVKQANAINKIIQVLIKT